MTNAPAGYRLPTYPPNNVAALLRDVQAWTRRANDLDPR